MTMYKSINCFLVLALFGLYFAEAWAQRVVRANGQRARHAAARLVQVGDAGARWAAARVQALAAVREPGRAAAPEHWDELRRVRR